jgi:ribonuclease R
MGRKSDRKPSKKNNSSSKGNTDSASLARKLLQFLDANFGQEFNAKQLIKRLEIRDSLNRGGVEPVLYQLVADGKISRSPRNFFSSTRDPEYLSLIHI